MFQYGIDRAHAWQIEPGLGNSSGDWLRYGCCRLPSLTLSRTIVRPRGEIICKRIRRSGKESRLSE